MAKSRKSKKNRNDDEDEADDVIEAEPFEEEEEEYEKREKRQAANDDPPAKGFFKQFGDGLKAAGAAAERYTRIGITMAELEKLRHDLKAAYQKLGENVARCWDAAPDIGVSATDSDVKDQLKRVNALRRQIREVEAKVRTLKNSGKVESGKAGKSDE